MQSKWLKHFKSKQLQPQVFIYEHYFDSAFGKGLFGNRPGIANSVETAAFFTYRGLHAWGFLVQTHRIRRGGVIFYSLHRVFYVGNNLIASGKNNDVPGTESDAGYPVAGHIEIDQFSGFCYRVCSGNEKIYQK